KQVALSRLCSLLASAVADSLRHGRLPCVLGGDHTCAGGTWTGVARSLRGHLGLVWVDAHMDSHTPGTSHTGRLHGMPLAWLLGQDDDPLYGLASGVLDPRHVCLVGVRSYELEESERLARLGVRVYLMEEVRQRGLQRALDDALRIASQNTAGFGISIDLDVVTPEDAPGVAVPAEGGLGGAELALALEGIGGKPGLAAVELVEYCPRLDQGGPSQLLQHARQIDFLLLIGQAHHFGALWSSAFFSGEDQDITSFEDARVFRRLQPAVDDNAQRLPRRLDIAHREPGVVGGDRADP